LEPSSHVTMEKKEGDMDKNGVANVLEKTTKKNKDVLREKWVGKAGAE